MKEEADSFALARALARTEVWLDRAKRNQAPEEIVQKVKERTEEYRQMIVADPKAQEFLPLARELEKALEERGDILYFSIFGQLIQAVDGLIADHSENIRQPFYVGGDEELNAKLNGAWRKGRWLLERRRRRLGALLEILEEAQDELLEMTYPPLPVKLRVGTWDGLERIARKIMSEDQTES